MKALFRPTEDYPDPNGTMLTDGVKGGDTIYGTGWVGWIGNSEPVEVTVDLGKVQEFYEIAVTTLEGEGGVTYPDYVTFSVSSDQNSFTELHTGLKPEDGAGKQRVRLYLFQS